MSDLTDSPPTDVPRSPIPVRERWQPLRSGVLNLYRYDYEEFHFEDGRLLLRGNNGSGKSRVLALQLPFLLDGEVNPARVEPDGDPAKRIEWNLLMGRHPDRTGYTWIEFGKREPDGTPRFFTLGCGMRAVAGHSGLHSRWFFSTSQRIGHDLFLQTSQRQPLGRDRLQEAIGPAGRVFTKAEDYRRNVDETLFGLGPRYGALLELLLRLRRPQLSRKLDEEELSGALSEALPTLPAAIIDEMAEAFRGLQADRETLRQFTEARDAVSGFLREYEVYMRIAVRRRAHTVRTTNSGYDAAQREAREAQARLEQASSDLGRLREEFSIFTLQLAGAEAVERTLRESPEMRTVDELSRAREAAEAAAKQRSEAESDERQAALAEARARERESQTRAENEQRGSELTACLQASHARALAAELAEVHQEYVPDPLQPSGASYGWIARAETALRRAIAQRGKAAEMLRQQARKIEAAELAFSSAEGVRRQAEEAANAAREAEHRARESLAESARKLTEMYTRWRTDTRHLQPPSPETWADSFLVWLEQREGPSPVRRAIESAQAVKLATLAAADAALQQNARELDVRIGDIDTEIRRLESGITAPPLAPHTRRAEREGRPGAPLWRLCDFRPDVPADSRAGIEAALESAGLLDAWILPDGGILDAVEDSFLLDADSGSIAGDHLGRVLAPALDPNDETAGSLSPALIESVLRRIGYGEGSGSYWISGDGGWRLGPVAGRWTKSAADYIGEGTRAAARRRRLEELQAARADALLSRARIEDAFAQLARDRDESATEFEIAPRDEQVLEAGYALQAATRTVAETYVASERAGRDSVQRRAERDEAVRLRDRDAADLKLSGWVDRVDELLRATHAYEAALAALWPTARHSESIAARFAAVREEVSEAEGEHRNRRERKESAAASAEATRQRYETLHATHGQEISLVLEKLGGATAEVKRLKLSVSENQRQQIDQASAQTRAESDRAHFEQQRSAREELRRAAVASLQRLAEQRLLAEAHPELRGIEREDWTVTYALEVARKIEPLLAETPIDDEIWRRRQDAIFGHFQELRDRLITQGHQPESHSFEDLVLVRCVFQARPHTMNELRDAFASELGERQRLLEAREREIIENHLLAEVAVEIQRLIRAAEAWRASANDELMARPTSSGVRFRFQWEADAETRFRDLRPILLRKGELWTPAERSALAAYLQDRIRAQQAADESGSWRDHLAQALDYRRWHRFVVERQQEGQWRRLDKRTYGTGSGGEKALALTLPRFAAAAAHYRSAAPTAPRLVMLDEAFAGIDPTMRAQCMGVLTQFDLDVVMTSELEWGCYATVPALSIYHLTAVPGIDAVATTRWVWNGRSRLQSDPVLPPSAPPGHAEESGMVPERDALDSAMPPENPDELPH